MMFTGLNYKLETSRTVTIYKKNVIKDMLRNSLAFYYIHSGSGFLEQHKEKLKFDEGDFIFIPAKQFISYVQPKGLSFSCVRFQANLFHHISLSDLYKLNRVAKLSKSSESLDAMSKLAELHHRDSEVICFEKYEYLNRLLKILFQQLKPKPVHKLKGVMQEYNPVFQFIEKHIHESISIKSLAEKMNLNSDYLSHRFKKLFGMPLSSFIQEKRVEKAMGLLIDDSVSITDISKMCGFNDPFYFSKVFKQVTGLSPRLYRQKIKEEEHF